MTDQQRSVVDLNKRLGRANVLLGLIAACPRSDPLRLSLEHARMLVPTDIVHLCLILELASQESVSKGVTSFQDAGSSFADVDLMKQMIDEGKINVRLWVMIRMNLAATSIFP